MSLTILNTTAVPLQLDNVDTDQIIPARFLKATTRDGFGENLFRDWRYNKDDSPKEDFILNDSTYSGQILLCGKNFGCGSSREHAAWAIGDYGFRVVVSSFFADIFKGNALNNGILTIQLTDAEMEILFDKVKDNPATNFNINLPEQFIEIENTDIKYSFDINPYKKMCLLKGYNDLDYLLSKSEEVKAFEKNRKDAFFLV